MKLNNNGWGYRIFVMCLCMISTFVILASHYLRIFVGVFGK